MTRDIDCKWPGDEARLQVHNYCIFVRVCGSHDGKLGPFR